MYVETESCATRFVIGRVTSTLHDVRAQLDALTYDGMIWSLYGSHRTVQPYITISMFFGFIRLSSMVQRHMPERV